MGLDCYSFVYSQLLYKQRRDDCRYYLLERIGGGAEWIILRTAARKFRVHKFQEPHYGNTPVSQALTSTA